VFAIRMRNYRENLLWPRYYAWSPEKPIGNYGETSEPLLKGVKMNRSKHKFNFWTCCFYKKNRIIFFLSFEEISQNVDIGYLLLPDIVSKVGFGIASKHLFLV